MEIKNLMRQAYLYGDWFSVDKSTHLGAILVDDTGKMRAMGVNTFTDDTQKEVEANYFRPRKYQVTEHAERSAIYYAARNGIATRGLTLICPWASCPDCARAAVMAGIKEVIGHKQAFDRTPDRWKDEINVGFEILKGGGVTYTFYDGKIGDVENLFNGEIWHP